MVDVGNLQAIVARSSTKPYLAILLFGIEKPGLARNFLRTWKPNVPAGFAAETNGQAALHFLFNWAGMAKLIDGRDGFDVGAGGRAFETFFVDPRQAPDGLAQQLGFIGKSAPENWWHQFKTADIEFAVYGAFDSPEQRHDLVRRLRETAADSGLVERQVPSFPNRAIEGYRPADGRVHFGYRDGLTNPDIDWTDSARPGSVDMRELIAGYPNADYPTAPFAPGPWRDFSREGSYACLTWISQDVGRFEAYLDETAPMVASLAGGADPKEWLAAKLVGRWRNGSALARHDDDQPNPPELSNDFGYSDDPDGRKCPLTAHIRVANSRDQPLKFANQVRFPKGPPRLVRRGFSYGSPWTGPADDAEDRGLMGLFFCARVNEQFYTVLRWMQRTDFSDAYKRLPRGLDAQDALIADRSAATANTTLHLSDAAGGTVDIRLATFLRYRGVAVLFAPGMRALAALADL